MRRELTGKPRELQEAASKGDSERVAALLAEDASLLEACTQPDGHTLLMVACGKGSCGVIEAMLSVATRKHVDAAAMDHVYIGSGSGGRKTALMYAAMKGKSQAIAALVNGPAGVDLNASDQLERTALMWAASSGDVKAVRALLAAPQALGLEVNQRDKDGSSAVLLAAKRFASSPSEAGALDSVRALLAHPGADPSTADRAGSTALHLAAKAGLAALVEVLLRANAEVDLQDKAGATPLALACRGQHAECARTLLQQGAKPWRVAQGPAREFAEAQAAGAGLVMCTGGVMHPRVLVSFRVKEARAQAVAVKRALEAEGVSTFCSELDIPQGADWVRTICDALELCRVVVVLASATYGSQGTDAFANMEELAYAKKHGKGLYLVRLAPRVADASASLLLGTVQAGCEWPPDSPADAVPVRLVGDVLAMLGEGQTASGGGGTGVSGSQSQQATAEAGVEAEAETAVSAAAAAPGQGEPVARAEAVGAGGSGGRDAATTGGGSIRAEDQEEQRGGAGGRVGGLPSASSPAALEGRVGALEGEVRALRAQLADLTAELRDLKQQTGRGGSGGGPAGGQGRGGAAAARESRGTEQAQSGSCVLC